MQARYGFSPGIQEWIISKRFARPSESLSDCGIKTSGHTVFLYLKSVPGYNRANSDTGVRQDQQNRQNEGLSSDSRSLPDMHSERSRESPNVVLGWKCPACTYVNSPSRPGCEMCSTDRPEGYRVPDDYVPDEKEQTRLQQAQLGEQLLLQVGFWRSHFR